MAKLERSSSVREVKEGREGSTRIMLKKPRSTTRWWYQILKPATKQLSPSASAQSADFEHEGLSRPIRWRKETLRRR